MTVRSWLALAILAAGTAAQNPDAGQEALDRFVARSAEYEKQVEAYTRILEESGRRLEAEVELYREAFAKGLVSARQVEEVERRLADLHEALSDQQNALMTVHQTVAEVQAAYHQALELERHPSWFRFEGTRSWTLDLADELDEFFRTRFGRELPVSAYGQTETHLELGFNHEDRLDVALHPGSDEGRALVDYLRAEGLPFTAFNAAVEGSATGAHIHVGPPSPRVF